MRKPAGWTLLAIGSLVAMWGLYALGSLLVFANRFGMLSSFEFVWKLALIGRMFWIALAAGLAVAGMGGWLLVRKAAPKRGNVSSQFL